MSDGKHHHHNTANSSYLVIHHDDYHHTEHDYDHAAYQHDIGSPCNLDDCPYRVHNDDRSPECESSEVEK